jgi:hypothetical protein
MPDSYPVPDSVGWSVGWLAGQSVSLSVGRSVGRSVLGSVSFLVLGVIKIDTFQS